MLTPCPFSVVKRIKSIMVQMVIGLGWINLTSSLYIAMINLRIELKFILYCKSGNKCSPWVGFRSEAGIQVKSNQR